MMPPPVSHVAWTADSPRRPGNVGIRGLDLPTGVMKNHTRALVKTSIRCAIICAVAKQMCWRSCTGP